MKRDLAAVAKDAALGARWSKITTQMTELYSELCHREVAIANDPHNPQVNAPRIKRAEELKSEIAILRPQLSAVSSQIEQTGYKTFEAPAPSSAAPPPSPTSPPAKSSTTGPGVPHALSRSGLAYLLAGALVVAGGIGVGMGGGSSSQNAMASPSEPVVAAGAPLAATGAYAHDDCTGKQITIFDSTNGDAVANGATPSTFSTHGRAHCVTYIQTYHWNSGSRSSPRDVGLLRISGPSGPQPRIGLFPAKATPGQNTLRTSTGTPPSRRRRRRSSMGRTRVRTPRHRCGRPIPVPAAQAFASSTQSQRCEPSDTSVGQRRPPRREWARAVRALSSLRRLDDSQDTHAQSPGNSQVDLESDPRHQGGDARRQHHDHPPGTGSDPNT